MNKRRSMIPIRRERLIGPRTATQCQCVGCERTIADPGLAPTGKALRGTQWFTQVKEWQHGGGNSVPVTTSRVGVVRYVKGSLCPECAGSYKQVQDSSGRWHDRIKVDPFLPPLRDAHEGKRSKSILNTRYTR